MFTKVPYGVDELWLGRCHSLIRLSRSGWLGFKIKNWRRMLTPKVVRKFLDDRCCQCLRSQDYLSGAAARRWPLITLFTSRCPRHPLWVLLTSADQRVTFRDGCLHRHIHPRWINPSDVNTLKDRSSLKLRAVLLLKWCLSLSRG